MRGSYARDHEGWDETSVSGTSSLLSATYLKGVWVGAGLNTSKACFRGPEPQAQGPRKGWISGFPVMFPVPVGMRTDMYTLRHMHMHNYRHAHIVNMPLYG